MNVRFTLLALQALCCAVGIKIMDMNYQISLALLLVACAALLVNLLLFILDQF